MFMRHTCLHVLWERLTKARSNNNENAMTSNAASLIILAFAWTGIMPLSMIMLNNVQMTGTLRRINETGHARKEQSCWQTHEISNHAGSCCNISLFNNSSSIKNSNKVCPQQWWHLFSRNVGLVEQQHFVFSFSKIERLTILSWMQQIVHASWPLGQSLQALPLMHADKMKAAKATPKVDSTLAHTLAGGSMCVCWRVVKLRSHLTNSRSTLHKSFYRSLSSRFIIPRPPFWPNGINSVP